MLANLLIFAVLVASPVASNVSPDDVPVATPVYVGVAVAEHTADDSDATPQNNVKTPLVSINTDVLDMSWTGAMDLADPEILRPTGIVLPFLESHPIDRFEVKLNLLNLQF